MESEFSADPATVRSDLRAIFPKPTRESLALALRAGRERGLRSERSR